MTKDMRKVYAEIPDSWDPTVLSKHTGLHIHEGFFRCESRMLQVFKTCAYCGKAGWYDMPLPVLDVVGLFDFSWIEGLCPKCGKYVSWKVRFSCSACCEERKIRLPRFLRVYAGKIRYRRNMKLHSIM